MTCESRKYRTRGSRSKGNLKFPGKIFGNAGEMNKPQVSQRRSVNKSEKKNNNKNNTNKQQSKKTMYFSYF